LKLNLGILKRDGFVQFKGNLVGEDTFGIANSLGNVANVPGAQIVQTLIPSDSTLKESSSYSGNYGMGEFPFHTDMAHWYKPPRFLLLRCVTPSVLVTTSILLAAPLFLPENKSDLRRSLFRPRRRLNGRLTPIRLFEKDFYRWDNLFLQPLSKMAKSLQERIEQRIEESSPHNFVLAQTGDCVLLDNWNTFHARSAVPPDASNRKVERVYLSALKG